MELASELSHLRKVISHLKPIIGQGAIPRGPTPDTSSQPCGPHRLRSGRESQVGAGGGQQAGTGSVRGYMGEDLHQCLRHKSGTEVGSIYGRK